MRHQPSCRFSQQAPVGMKTWLNAGMAFQPGPGVLAVVAGKVAGDDDHDLAVWAGGLYLLQEPLIAAAGAGRGAHGDFLAIGDAHPP
jgi:hypothetical protein